MSCNAATQDRVKFDSPNILSAVEMREFYISFADSLLEVGRVGEPPFIKLLLTCPVDVKYIGIASGYGTTAAWTFCGFGKNGFYLIEIQNPILIFMFCYSR